MRPTSVLKICALLAVIAGCSTSQPSTGPADSAITVISVDLDDPATQRALGSPPPEGIVWQRSAGELTIVGRTAAAEPEEIELVDGALSDLPASLLAAAEPRFVVRVANVAGAETLAAAVTVTFGPDIYLLDRTFGDGTRKTSRLDLTYAFAHELAHVGQWKALDPAHVNRVLSGQIPGVRLEAGSSLVRDFAVAVGWIDESTDPDQPAWRLARGASPTPYGATSPVEDLADTVALAAVGRTNWIDEARLTWIGNWLKTNTGALAEGMPWIPVGAEEVYSPTPLFDESLAARLAADRAAAHIEPASFVLSNPLIADAVEGVETQLRRRGLEGTLGLIGNSSFPRYQGTFVRPDGVVFLVELWDFTETGEDNEAVLTYVVIW